MQSMMNMATIATTASSSDLAKAEQLKCPRCDSSNTKFCYYNNYSLSQPRYLCKACKRYWTRGGTLRNVPAGGGRRKNKRVKKHSANSIKLSNPNPIIRSSLANPNVHLSQLPTSSSADLSSWLYGDLNLFSFSTSSPQLTALGVGGLINVPNLTFLNNNDYSSFGSHLKEPKIKEYNQSMFPYEDLQQANADLGDQNNFSGNIPNNSEIFQASYPCETLMNVARDSSYLNANSAMGNVSGCHDATNSSILFPRGTLDPLGFASSRS